MFKNRFAAGKALAESLRHHKSSDAVVVAVPVAPPHTAERFQTSGLIDELVCLATPENFIAVGQFYDQFGQVSDEEVVDLMARANKWDLKEKKLRTNRIAPSPHHKKPM